MADLRSVNTKLLDIYFELPDIQDTLLKLGGVIYISSLDLMSAYYMIHLTPETKHKTAFTTRKGRYCYNRMPFGVKTACMHFQRVMTHIFRDYLDFIIIYVDDILIISKTREEHINHIYLILKRMLEYGLRLKASKVKFFRKFLDFLGHVITPNGITPQEEKIKALKILINAPHPKNKTDVKKFIGAASYYRIYLKSFSLTLKPLFDVSTKETFQWGPVKKKLLKKSKNKWLKT